MEPHDQTVSLHGAFPEALTQDFMETLSLPELIDVFGSDPLPPSARESMRTFATDSLHLVLRIPAGVDQDTDSLCKEALVHLALGAAKIVCLDRRLAS